MVGFLLSSVPDEMLQNNKELNHKENIRDENGSGLKWTPIIH
jgi:hypothetical protein